MFLQTTGFHRNFKIIHALIEARVCKQRARSIDYAPARSTSKGYYIGRLLPSILLRIGTGY